MASQEEAKVFFYGTVMYNNRRYMTRDPHAVVALITHIWYSPHVSAAAPSWHTFLQYDGLGGAGENRVQLQ